MTPDLWQLHTWTNVECIANPNPRARTIIIGGYRKEYYRSYKITFKNQREMSYFVLKYSDYFQSVCHVEDNDYTQEHKEELWHTLSIFCIKVKYESGPVI